MNENIIQIAVGVIAGGLICAGVAKYAIHKSLRDLESALFMCHEIKERLAAISVKIEALEELSDRVCEHDRQITILEHASRN